MMVKHNLAISDLSSSRSAPPSYYAGRCSYEEGDRARFEPEYPTQLGRPPSTTAGRISARLHLSSGDAKVRDQNITLAMSFGPFHILPNQRLLLRAGRPVHIGS